MGEHQRSIRSCPKTDCTSYKKEIYNKEKIFCERCGFKIDDIQITEQADAVSTYEVAIEALKERLYSADINETLEDGTILHRYLSNYGHGYRSFNPHAIENRAIEHRSAQVSEDKEKLETEHRGDLSYLRKVYGLDNVTTKWGLIFTAG
jgi:hypothetical protein